MKAECCGSLRLGQAVGNTAANRHSSSSWQKVCLGRCYFVGLSPTNHLKKGWKSWQCSFCSFGVHILPYMIYSLLICLFAVVFGIKPRASVNTVPLCIMYYSHMPCLIFFHFCARSLWSHLAFWRTGSSLCVFLLSQILAMVLHILRLKWIFFWSRANQCLCGLQSA